MRTKKLTTITTLLLISVVAGCAKEPPKCSDEATLILVRQLFAEKLSSTFQAPPEDIASLLTLESVRPSGYDEKIKRYSCEAQGGVAGKVTLPLQFESQLDDKGNHLVGLSNFVRRDDYLLIDAVLTGLAKIRTKPTATQVAPVPESSVTLGVTPAKIVGIWKGKTDGGEGELAINQAPGGYALKLELDAPGCGGSIDGVGTLAGDKLTLTKSDSGQTCTLTLQFDGAQATLDESNCSYFHGGACDFSGTYKKQK